MSSLNVISFSSSSIQVKRTYSYRYVTARALTHIEISESSRHATCSPLRTASDESSGCFHPKASLCMWIRGTTSPVSLDVRGGDGTRGIFGRVASERSRSAALLRVGRRLCQRTLRPRSTEVCVRVSTSAMTLPVRREWNTLQAPGSRTKNSRHAREERKRSIYDPVFSCVLHVRHIEYAKLLHYTLNFMY